MKGNEMAEQKVYIQHNWTDKALVADGFLSYRPVKRMTMARMLPLEEAPKIMIAAGNEITAEAGYWIAYAAGDVLKSTLDDYKPRPVDPDIFAETYRSWDEPNWQPTPTEAHLQQLGCKPYYKIASVWAKQLTAETWVKGMESDEATMSPKGAWLCIGTEGEPWSMTEVWFQAHYMMPGHTTQREVNNSLLRRSFKRAFRL
jgi:hypothetical protein